MGGKSKSNQSTSNAQSTLNLVNDGDYAGASNFVVDETQTNDSNNVDSSTTIEDSNNTTNEYEDNTDNSIEDAYNTTNEYEDNTDNSIEDAYNTTNEYEIDNSIEDSNNTTNEYEIDNSIEDSNNTTNEYEDNTDNSIEYDGEFAGNNGNISFVDAGALGAASEIAENSLFAANEAFAQSTVVSLAALDSNERITSDAFAFGNSAFDFGESTIIELSNVATNAMGSVNQFGTEVIDSLSGFGTDAIDNITLQSKNFADELASVTQANISSNQSVLEQAAISNSDDKAIIAELARTTSLAGQDIIAESSTKMTLYMSIAMGVGFIAILFLGRRA
ncbi:MAG: hypothetical protein ACI9LM_000105 [Alteromonadaceae bacterium]|jgi:hypothetical protein